MKKLEYIKCRAWGHEWEEVNPTRKSRFGFLFSLRCVRCGTTRNDIFDINGVLQHREYVYPDGYQSNEGRWTIEELRLEIARRRRNVS